ncbi:energy transducer TonB [Flavobacteriales bacterium 34_180_T64]|nr:energy transducer TonB [Flavobacteriales bacterium 34_180_T64]
MKPKKNPDIEVCRNSSLYFAIGLNLMLLLTWGLLEWKTYDKAEVAHDVLVMDKEMEEEIPIININTPPPPPPPITVNEAITVVEDLDEVEETIIESSETNLDEAIDEPIAKFDDISVEEIEEDIEVPFSVIENVPVFPGCSGSNDEKRACFQKKMQKHIQKNFRYPDVAVELGMTGRVIVLFVIDTDGKITGIRSRGPDKLLENEAERIIGLLPIMKPGKQRGRNVRVPYSIPIYFKLQNH